VKAVLLPRKPATKKSYQQLQLPQQESMVLGALLSCQLQQQWHLPMRLQAVTLLVSATQAAAAAAAAPSPLRQQLLPPLLLQRVLRLKRTGLLLQPLQMAPAATATSTATQLLLQPRPLLLLLPPLLSP
jgi:hypothetical protein